MLELLDYMKRFIFDLPVRVDGPIAKILFGEVSSIYMSSFTLFIQIVMNLIRSEGTLV